MPGLGKLLPSVGNGLGLTLGFRANIRPVLLANVVVDLDRNALTVEAVAAVTFAA